MTSLCSTQQQQRNLHLTVNCWSSLCVITFHKPTPFSFSLEVLLWKPKKQSRGIRFILCFATAPIDGWMNAERFLQHKKALIIHARCWRLCFAVESLNNDNSSELFCITVARSSRYQRERRGRRNNWQRKAEACKHFRTALLILIVQEKWIFHLCLCCFVRRGE